MTPEVRRDFEARCRALCPAFRAIAARPARKSQLLAGEVDGRPVIAKRLARPTAVWAWYFAREVAIYRVFAASPAPVRAPALVAASDDLLIIERLPGAPLATRRNPEAALPPATVDALIAAHDAFTGYAGALPATPPPATVRAQLRARFLEDPTAPIAWILDGLARAAQRGLIEPAVADRARGLLAAAEVVPSHGDLLLRNVIAGAEGIGLVDWECAGRHVADWDLALLWTQLAPALRPRVEAAARSPGLLALVTFALAREVAFLRAFRVGARHPGLARIRAQLAEVSRRL